MCNSVTRYNFIAKLEILFHPLAAILYPTSSGGVLITSITKRFYSQQRPMRDVTRSIDDKFSRSLFSVWRQMVSLIRAYQKKPKTVMCEQCVNDIPNFENCETENGNLKYCTI